MSVWRERSRDEERAALDAVLAALRADEDHLRDLDAAPSLGQRARGVVQWAFGAEHSNYGGDGSAAA